MAQTELPEDEDESRISRLFYLQLHASVLKAEREAEELRKKTKAKLAKSWSWMDVTNLLARQVSSSSSSEQERDVGDSFHPQEMAIDQREMLTPSEAREVQNNLTMNIRNHRRIEPILNDRMKNLSNNFTMRYRDRESVVEHKSYTCRAKRVFFSSLYVSVATVAVVLVLFMLFDRPNSYGSYYETLYMSDREPLARPRVGLCFSMPFSEAKLREMRVPAQLASFLLYSLSPFFPNQDILDNQDLLEELSTQYRSLVSRISRTNSRLSGSSSRRGLRKILRSMAPRCTDVIAGCQTGTKQIIRGEDCCRRIFNRIEYSLQGLCLVANDFTRISAEVDFPVTNPGTVARLTVVLNATAAHSVPVDHRIIPWEAARTSVVRAAFVHEKEELSYRNSRRDIDVGPGQTVSIDVRKRAVDNAYPTTALVGSCASVVNDNHELFGDSLYAQADCRSSAIQMIAEKSVNCSLLSLPRINKSLPICGPLEGLALMYILREQGLIVSINPEMMDTFQENISANCPVECYFQYFDPEASRVAVDETTAELFGARRASELSIIELKYRADEYIRVRRYQSGLVGLFYRLGSICGCGLMVLFVGVMARRLCAKRKGFLFNQAKKI